MQRLISLLLAMLLVAGVSAFAASTATDLLLAKARSLEGRGLMDLAAQSWQQVLMSDPNQPEALAGLARWAKQNGRTEEANQYLERLRKVNPQDPAITSVESLKVVGPKQRARLDEAGRLAQAHQYEESLAIYREVLGNDPPPGNWAVAYYETEAATPDGYDVAVAGIRRMAERFPNDPKYGLSLGRLLTYRPANRGEGMQILAAIPANSVAGDAARKAWRQALLWDAGTGGSQASLQEYLKRYPDTELQALISKPATPTTLTAAETAAAAQGVAERRGYEALNADNLAAAESEFQSVLKGNPKSAGALSGMGFVRMKQEDFNGAIEYFEKAKAISPGEAVRVNPYLTTARFWSAMKRGNRALAEKQADVAVTLFQQAMKIRPNNVEALQGYAGALMMAGDAATAVTIYKRITELTPANAAAWRGLVKAQFDSGDANGANETIARFPVAVRAELARDVDYLALLVAIYSAEGRDTEIQSVVQEALILANSRDGNAGSEIELQFAALLLQNGQPQRAASLYQRVADLHPDSAAAWEGLVSAQLGMHDYPRAVAALRRMPRTTYDLAIRNPKFLLLVASIYENQGQEDTAEGFVQRAAEIESAGDHKPSVATQLALAGIWLKQGHTEEANRAFRAILDRNPENPDAWKGYLAALHQQKNDQVAFDVAQQIPEPVLAGLKKDVGYLSLMASVNGALGQYDEARRELRQAMFHYELLRQRIPASLELQMAWLLLDAGGDERELYSLLSQEASRRDLTTAQRMAFQDIWATWSLRQAEAARLAGNPNREIEILEAASRALPNNDRIRGTLAGALLTKGDAHRAYALYKTWGLKGGDANDYLGAVGAAMTVHEDTQANAWISDGLRRWPENSSLLMLAARAAQSRGDLEKAKAYYESALQHLTPSAAGGGLAGPGAAKLQERRRVSRCNGWPMC